MATSVYERDYYFRDNIRTFRWGAAIAGFFVAIGCQVILMAIGAALGISAASVGGARDVSQGLGIAAGIWMVLSPILSLFLGGLAASYVAKPVTKGAGSFHGVMVWCLATVFGLSVLTAFASIFGAGLTGVAAAGGNAASNQNVQQRIEQESEQFRAQLDQNREELAQTGEKAADVGTGVAWASVFGLLLSLGAAALGGRAGVPTPLEEELPTRRIVQPRPDETETRPDLH